MLDAFRHTFRGFDDLRRKFQRQIILLDDRKNLQPHIAYVAQNLNDLAFGVAPFNRPFGDFCHYLLVGLGPAEMSFHNINILPDTFIVGCYKAKIAALMKNTDNLIIRMSDDTNYLSLRLIAAAGAFHTCHYTVIVHCPA